MNTNAAVAVLAVVVAVVAAVAVVLAVAGAVEVCAFRTVLESQRPALSMSSPTPWRRSKGFVSVLPAELTVGRLFQWPRGTRPPGQSPLAAMLACRSQRCGVAAWRELRASEIEKNVSLSDVTPRSHANQASPRGSRRRRDHTLSRAPRRL